MKEKNLKKDFSRLGVVTEVIHESILERMLVSQVGFPYIFYIFGILKSKHGKCEECNTNRLNMLVVSVHERCYLCLRILQAQLKEILILTFAVCTA